MALASVGADGMPSLRMVLLKGVDDRGSSSTNYEGRRATAARPSTGGALLSLEASKRRVRIEQSSR
jgi:pyridoxamine 5'-phosphate oxidase